VVEQLPPQGCASALYPAVPSWFSAVDRFWPTTLGGAPGAAVVGADPAWPDGGELPAPGAVEDGGDEDVPGPTEVEVGVAPDAVVVVVVVLVVVRRFADGVEESLGAFRMPATARFCCAVTWGPLEQAAAVPASARKANDMTTLLGIRCRVGLSFRGSRGGQGRTRTPPGKQ
jgi:hypothetical protein